MKRRQGLKKNFLMNTNRRIKSCGLSGCAAAMMVVAGCATNAVTGKKELHFIPESHEIALGARNYGPMQQSQGGQQLTFAEVNDYVNQVGRRLTEVSDRPEFDYEFVVLNNPVPNAWALPGGKIAVNRGLLTKLKSEAELAAVLGHEIVHAAARHSGKNIQRGLFLQAGMMGLGIAFQDHNYRDLIVGAGGISAQLLNQKYGRDAEREADVYGIKYMAAAGYDVKQAVELQKTFVRLAQESGGGDANWLTGLFASHPPSVERVKANEITVQQYDQNGFVGQEVYEEAMARLREAESAYDKLEEGYKALEAGRPKQALSLATQAIRMEPKEAHFFGLSGKAKAAMRNYPEALADLDQAIRLNDTYFDFYLQRGLIRKKLGQLGPAQTDLAKSTNLLPTGEGHEALGLLALTEGRPTDALTHLRIAASAPSEAGRSARIMLARLELPSNPQRYIQPRIGRDSSGRLTVRIINQSPLPVRNVQFTIYLTNEGDQVASHSSVVLQKIIQPGDSADAPTRVGPFRSDDHIAAVVRVTIDSATIAE